MWCTPGMASAAQDIVGRPVAELVDVAVGPLDHLGQALVPADRLLPTERLADRGGIEPVAAVLAEPVAGHLPQFFERHPQPPGAALPDLADRGGGGRAGRDHPAGRAPYGRADKLRVR